MPTEGQGDRGKLEIVVRTRSKLFWADIESDRFTTYKHSNFYYQNREIMTKPTVSISPETVTATEGETFVWNISLDQPAPEGGLSLFLPITENNDPAPGDVEYNVEGSSNIVDFEFLTNDESVSQIFAFGDSYSDDGLSFKISTDAVNADVPDSFILPADPELGLYDESGRWTNGLTAVEVLSENLEVDLTSYAVGGAKSGDGNYYSWLDSFQNTGVSGQVEQFESDLGGQPADSDALYFIFASANDFFEYSDFGLPGTVEELATQTVENIKQEISDLSALGAEEFFVVNSSDLGILPGTIEFEQAEDAALFTEEVNSLLPQELSTLEEELDIDITLYDHTAISDEIRENPQDFGLTNVDDPAQPVFPVEPTVENPDEYYFWDEYHPTRRVHEIIGEDMVNFVNPDENVSEGFNITIAEGETEAVLVSEVLIDDEIEGEESFTTIIAESDDYLVDPNQNQVVTNLLDLNTSTNSPDPIFGTTESDTIEINGSGRIVFAGDHNDLVDASFGSEGGNRIYGGNGHDTIVLGEGDRIFGGEGGDRIFATSGGNNTISGGAGTDQFWVATAELSESANVITDFTLGEDVIGIAGLGIGFEDLTINQTDAGASISVNDSDLALVNNIAADSLDSDNFAFG